MKLFLLLLLVLAIAILASSCGTSPSAQRAKAAKAQYPTEYTNGQILYPDYTHTDTLVVINARAINRIFSGDGGLFIDGSDKSISDVLYLGAIPINKNQHR